MKFPAMLRRLRNTQSGTGATSSSPYSPYTPVPPVPPVAEAGSDQLAVVNKEVSFDGSDSTSPYGGSLKYSWDFRDETNPTAVGHGMMASYTYTTPGTKRVTLTVTDRKTGLTHSDTVTITVIEVGVRVTGTPRVVVEGTQVNFTGTVENAPEGADLKYSWDLGDGAISLRNVDGLTPSCQYTKPTDKKVRLTVDVTLDGQEVQVKGTFVIKVLKVDAGRNQIVAVDETVQFEGSVLNAPEDLPLIYSWDFGDDATNAQGDNGLMPSCSYTRAGDKNVRLTVSFNSDGVLVEGSGTVKIPVLESRLRVQGERALSQLEQDAFNLVFGDSNSIKRPEIKIVEHIPHAADTGGAGGSYDAVNDIVKIARDKHPYAEDLDGDTTVDDIDLTIPHNIKYLATQSLNNRYNIRIGKYEFDNEVLEDLDFECKEQHASAGQVYFILKWQLHHGHDPINITVAGEGKSVGPVNRYASIADIHPINGDRHINRSEAIQLVNNFDNYLADLR